MLSFYLGDIQVCHMESVLLLHPLLDLLVCSPLLKPGHIHIFKRELHPNILTRYVSLGKLDNGLKVPRDLNSDVLILSEALTLLSIECKPVCMEILFGSVSLYYRY